MDIDVYQSSPLQRWQILSDVNPVCSENASVKCLESEACTCVYVNASGVPFGYMASRLFHLSISAGRSCRPPSGMLSMGDQKLTCNSHASIWNYWIPTAWMPSKKIDCNCSAQAVLISRSVFSPSKSLLDIQLCRRRVQKECLIRCSPHSSRVHVSLKNLSCRIQESTIYMSNMSAK